MGFNNRSQFINAAASDKIVLAQVHANKRVINWVNHAGSVYKRTLPYFVNTVKNGTSQLAQVFAIGSISAGTFFYEIETGTVYIQLTDSSDPVDAEMIIQYRFFFANKSLSTAYNLSDTGQHVHYEGRIMSAPAYDHQIGIEQDLSSIVGTGTLKLQNIDAELDEIYETMIFENQEIYIYNWNQDIPISEAQIIYRGRVTNKFFEENFIQFTVKDNLFDVLQKLPQSPFTADDNVNASVQGNIKRWVYGRVDGLRSQSVDQIGEGYLITGTVSGASDSLTLNGVGTAFLSELSPDDRLTIGTLEFTIDDITSNTVLTVTDNPNYAFTGSSATVVPSRPNTSKNRIHFVAGHATAKLTKTVVNALQFNRIELSDTVGLNAGDFIEFVSTSERLEIKNTAPGNIVVLRQNVITVPGIGTSVIRQPIQKVFIEGQTVLDADFSINNSSSETTITLDTDTEFNLADEQSIAIDLTFTNGTRNVTTVEDVDLKDIYQTRDWIRPSDLSYTTYYEVLKVDTQSMTIRTVFADATHTGPNTLKSPNYVGDSTIVSMDVLGRTENNEPDGIWIRTAAATVRDVLTQLNISNLDATSFTDAMADADHLVSMAIPFSISSTLTSGKTVIDAMNKSVFGALTLNNNLDLRYKILLVESASDLVELQDSDVISFKIKASNGKTYRNSIIQYRHQDIIRGTLQSGFLTETHDSDFVNKMIGTNDSHNIDVYLYATQSAKTMAHRDIYYNQLSRSTITIKSDLRLENLLIGQAVGLNFNRLYKRYGDTSTRKKIAYIVGKKVDGASITFLLSDIGNTFNQSCIIAPNTMTDYASATVDERLKYGFITDSNGIVDDQEDTANTNLIT